MKGLKSICTAAAADQGIDIELYHPGSGAPLGIIVNMKGSDSQAYQDSDRNITRRNLAQSARKRDFTLNLDPEVTEARIVENMKACFNSWKEQQEDGAFKPTLCFEEGVELASNKEEFGKIITNRGFYWFRQQVQEGMDKVANFLPKVQTASAPTPPTSTNMIDPARTE